MGFRSIDDYDSEKYGNLFRLQNHGDSAKVIFLYRSTKDVMVVDAHYLITDSYTGYAQCLGRNNGCPACNYVSRNRQGHEYKGIRIQTELFIPLYVLESSDPQFKGPGIYFWDRTTTFQAQLMNDVFRSYPDPSKYVFSVIRDGQPRDRNTRYKLQACATSPYTYDQILSNAGVTFPEYYNTVCKAYSADEMSALLNPQGIASPNPSLGQYNAIPRVSVDDAALPEMSIPEVSVPQDNAPEFNANDTAPFPEYKAPEATPAGLSEVQTSTDTTDVSTSDTDDSGDVNITF